MPSIKFCADCKYQGETKTTSHGNFAGEVAVWVVILIACAALDSYIFMVLPVIYTFYRQLYKTESCSRCTSMNVLDPANQAVLDIKNQKPCPFCAETIKQEAIKCKHCGADLPAA